MAEVGQALFALLTTDPATSALIGNRVMPLRLMDTQTIPAITYQQIAGPRVTTHDEPNNSLAQTSYQLDIWAEDYDTMRAIAAAARVLLNGYKGTAGGLTLQAVLITDEREDSDGETRLYRIIQTYAIWHEG
jgi:hypothetical protein